MAWKLIKGYKYPYRVSDQGEVQKHISGDKWVPITPWPHGYGSLYCVWLQGLDGVRVRVSVSQLVADAFLGGTPPGMRRAHRNGMRQDNAVENIVFVAPSELPTRYRPGNSRPVLKIDRAGNVVDFYPSASEAARKNHFCKAAMTKRCRGKVEDTYRADGYKYVYEDLYMSKKRGRKK